MIVGKVRISIVCAFRLWNTLPIDFVAPPCQLASPLATSSAAQPSEKTPKSSWKRTYFISFTLLPPRLAGPTALFNIQRYPAASGSIRQPSPKLLSKRSQRTTHFGQSRAPLQLPFVLCSALFQIYPYTIESCTHPRDIQHTSPVSKTATFKQVTTLSKHRNYKRSDP
jgi:hypothetical protein